MLVYSSTVHGFLCDVQAGTIDTAVANLVRQRLRHRVGKAERRAWANSLQEIAWAFHDTSIPDDAGISIEYRLPMSSKRLDFLVSGYDDKDHPNLAIVELKQWSHAKPTPLDGVVRVRFQHGEANVSHPSYQAWSYAAFLRDFNETVETEEYLLHPCVYLHNYLDDGVLTHSHYSPHVERAPLFFKNQRLELQLYLEERIKRGDSGRLMTQLEESPIRPSKALADTMVGLLEGNAEFILLDEQKVAFEAGLEAMRRAATGKKQVLIVHGGPGTGKSVVAIHLLVEALKQGRTAAYVSKNAAPRDVYKERLTGKLTKSRFDALFRGSGSFMDAEADCFDLLIVDEAHRLNEKSGLYGNLGENQVKELITAARATVFFLDEDQRIHLADIGSEQEINDWALLQSAEVSALDLPSQFRCKGSDGYLAWLDHALQLRSTAQVDLGDIDYDFRVFSSPISLHETIAAKNAEDGKARVVAGYTWPWHSKKDPGRMDVTYEEYGYAKQWNLQDDGTLWLVRETSINEVGCIHTCQGLELSYVGVLIGGDLVVRDGVVVTRPENRARHDRTVRGWKTMAKGDPEGTSARLDRLIKNTYRTLMTRGMKGCFVFSDDQETREHFEQTIAAP